MATGILKSSATVYEFSLPAMQQLIASDLGVPSDKVQVEYVIQEVSSDPMDRYPGVKKVVSVRVTVDNAPPYPQSYSAQFDCDGR